jgi:cytidyltransferase-like protein
MKKSLIIVSGYFNPLHSGHLEYFKLAKKLGDNLLVIVNNDTQRELKGSKEFMLQKERITIVKELRIVDKVYLSVDTDRSVSKTIKKVFNDHHKNYNIFFANGGDQKNEMIPEAKICSKLGIELIDKLGKKIQSSSWLLNK